MSVTGTAEMLLRITSQSTNFSLHSPMGKTFKLSFRGLGDFLWTAGMTNPKSNSCNSKLVQGTVLASSTNQPLKHLKFQTSKTRKLKEGSPRKSLPSVQSIKYFTRRDLYSLPTCLSRYPPSLNLPIFKHPNHPAPNPQATV